MAGLGGPRPVDARLRFAGWVGWILACLVLGPIVLLADSGPGVTPEEQAEARQVVISFLDRLVRDRAISGHQVKPEGLDFWQHSVFGTPGRLDTYRPVVAQVRRGDFSLNTLQLLDVGLLPTMDTLPPTKVEERAHEYLRRYTPPDVAGNTRLFRIDRDDEAGPPGLPFQPGWQVNWVRCYQGHPFKYDGCRVRLTFDGQFRGFHMNWDSHAPPTLEVRVDAKRAEELGRLGAKRIMKRFPVRFEKKAAPEFKRSELKIVNPNYCHTFKTEDLERFGNISIESRLAWVVYFLSADFTAEALGGQDFDLEVHIDAATGELLGGEFYG